MLSTRLPLTKMALPCMPRSSGSSAIASSTCGMSWGAAAVTSTTLRPAVSGDSKPIINAIAPPPLIDSQVATSESMSGGGAMALMIGFESPLTAGRSVVDVTAAAPQDMPQVLDAMADEPLLRGMHGSAIFVSGKRVESILAGKTYTLGELPIWTMIWFPMSGHPILLGIMSVLAVLVFAFALWRSLRAIAARRLKVEKR